MTSATENSRRVAAMSVIMPVHNEAGTVGSAVRAVADAARQVDLPVSLTVVFDRCTDSSEEQVEDVRGYCAGLEIRTLSGYFAHIGAVRNAGVADATTWGAASGIALERHWTAHTDADSLVPPQWLSCQRDDADAGLDLVIGTVTPDEAPDSETVRLWSARHTLDEGHSSVHGANLGVRLDRLLAVGGFAGIAVGEDVATVRLLKDIGVPWTATDRGRVLTSARRTSRVSGGFADYLRDMDTRASRTDPAEEPTVGT
ncbi:MULTISPECIES: glycosyltransferase family 2 protein [Corynebacterium]|uniref:glycosyltransferase n=1 Tax=Corynebacterium TaxID=1716 RepID=UPI0011AB4522|nr:MULTISPECIES: glycosyltransferase [Corynebacterium]